MKFQISGVWVQIPPVSLFQYINPVYDKHYFLQYQPLIYQYLIPQLIICKLFIQQEYFSLLRINLSNNIFITMRYTGKISVLLTLIGLLVVLQAKTDYKVVNTIRNSTTVTLTLYYTGSDSFYIKQSSPIVKTLKFEFHTQTFFDFTFKFTDANNKRFEVPQYGVFPIDPLANFSFPIAASAVNFEYTESPFDFKIMRKQDGAVLFSTYNQQIIFSDHYLEIGTEIDSEYIYGIGERFQETFRKKDGKWTVFNRDRGQVIDRGTGQQTYGHFPFYLLKEKSRNLFHISYFRNSNAMDVIKSTKDNKHYITYKVIGGVLDFRFFLGEQSPQATVQKLNLYNGRAAIPPFWSFGFHQCRWGYQDISYLEAVASNYQKNGLPLDTIWTDIDYMIDYEDFTIDEKRFPLDRLNKLLQKYRYIPIIDAGIKNSGPAYEEGLKRGVYVKEANSQKPYVGRVWPGPTTFVDFFHPNSTQYWADMLDKVYQKVKFSGIWLDMNELANFCDGACQKPSGAYVYDYSKDLPYQPGSDQIESHTISLNATHYGNLTQANVHAYSGFLETYATNQFLKSKLLRPFIITRSSTFGSSKFGFHWTGDNAATWEYLKGSIADNFNNQMFGFQMVGPDICGFGGNTNEELCARWFQLGSLYTFARNHNDHDSISQEPYALGETVLKASKVNLKLRYSLLKYFYLLFINKRGLGSIWRPLFFDFPYDPNAYIDEVADTQFMIGPNILVTPIVEQGKTSRKIYLPEVNWYYFHTGVRYGPGTHLLENVGLTDLVPIFIREGFVMISQNTQNVVNTKQLGNSFTILSGMRFDDKRSNETTKVYESVGSVLSINDYNDEGLVEQCLRAGCEYVITLIARISSSSRTLQLDFTYLGGITLAQQVLIEEIHLGLDKDIIVITLEKPISITGPKRVTIPIPKPSEQESDLLSQQ